VDVGRVMALQPFKRLLVKLSGELLSGENGVFSASYLNELSEAVLRLSNEGKQVAFVVGGGNIWRGRDADLLGINGTDADYIGMLSTAVNGLMLKSCFESRGLKVELVSSFLIEGTAYRRHPSEIRSLLENQVTVIFVGGTGMPHLTTDTLAAIRAVEISADLLLKLTRFKFPVATKVSDFSGQIPFFNPSAKGYCRQNMSPGSTCND